MRRAKRLLGASSLLLALGLFQPSAADATTIHFQATDLTDTGLGDLWRYDYFVSDHTFNADDGFAVYFGPAFYSDLHDPFRLQRGLGCHPLPCPCIAAAQRSL